MGILVGMRMCGREQNQERQGIWEETNCGRYIVLWKVQHIVGKTDLQEEQSTEIMRMMNIVGKNEGFWETTKLWEMWRL